MQFSLSLSLHDSVLTTTLSVRLAYETGFGLLAPCAQVTLPLLFVHSLQPAPPKPSIVLTGQNRLVLGVSTERKGSAVLAGGSKDYPKSGLDNVETIRMLKIVKDSAIKARPMPSTR